ncbi:hypothetical protein HWV62_10843 [Athelia sp. TMB]|nr:hypothetical protein HWV62_10843 [Athelia sp. TMB]
MSDTKMFTNQAPSALRSPTYCTKARYCSNPTHKLAAGKPVKVRPPFMSKAANTLPPAKVTKQPADQPAALLSEASPNKAISDSAADTNSPGSRAQFVVRSLSQVKSPKSTTCALWNRVMAPSACKPVAAPVKPRTSKPFNIPVRGTPAEKTTEPRRLRQVASPTPSASTQSSSVASSSKRTSMGASSGVSTDSLAGSSCPTSAPPSPGPSSEDGKGELAIGSQELAVAATPLAAGHRPLLLVNKRMAHRAQGVMIPKAVDARPAQPCIPKHVIETLLEKRLAHAERIWQASLQGDRIEARELPMAKAEYSTCFVGTVPREASDAPTQKALSGVLQMLQEVRCQVKIQDEDLQAAKAEITALRVHVAKYDEQTQGMEQANKEMALLRDKIAALKAEIAQVSLSQSAAPPPPPPPPPPPGPLKAHRLSPVANVTADDLETVTLRKITHRDSALCVTAEMLGSLALRAISQDLGKKPQETRAKINTSYRDALRRTSEGKAAGHPVPAKLRLEPLDEVVTLRPTPLPKLKSAVRDAPLSPLPIVLAPHPKPSFAALRPVFIDLAPRLEVAEAPSGARLVNLS